MIPAVTTRIASGCPKCGIMKKSGRNSCCGRGGSWFNNCGGAGNANFDHTWFEGLQACRAWPQSKIETSQQVVAAQQKSDVYSNDVGVAVSRAVDASSYTFSSMSINKPMAKLGEISTITQSITTPSGKSIDTSTHTSINTSILTTDSAHTLVSTSVGAYDNGRASSAAITITFTATPVNIPSPTRTNVMANMFSNTSLNAPDTRSTTTPTIKNAINISMVTRTHVSHSISITSQVNEKLFISLFVPAFCLLL